MILNVFTCKHCKGNFVIVKANKTLIPVNCLPDSEYPEDTIYLKDEMETHLKKCEGRKNDWQEVLKLYLLYPEMRMKKIKVIDRAEHVPGMDERTITRLRAEEEKIRILHNKQFQKILAEEMKQKGLE